MSTPPSEQPPPQNKSRKKRPVEDVSFEDLLAAHKSERKPGELPAEGIVLIGVDVEFQRRMAEGIGRPLPPAADFGAAIVGAPDISAPIAPQSAAPNNDALNTGAPNFTEPEFDLRDLLTRGTRSSYPVHPVSRIEDAFTSAERDLLRWLWERGRPVPAKQEIRLVTGSNGEGARRLAVQAGLIYNTFKNLSRALSTKFAIDIVKPEKNLPAIYVVYDNQAILERQRQAGFTGAVRKNGGGRDLVNATAQPASRRPDLSVEELGIIIGAPIFSAHN